MSAGTGLAWLLAALLVSPAAAHPQDEVVQGAYLTLAPGEVRVELDITPGPQVAEALLRALDAHADQYITDAEARDYAESVLRQSTLMLDEMALSWRLEKVRVPPYGTLALAADTIRIYAVARRPDRAGTHRLSYENRYAPAKSQVTANVFLQPGPDWRYEVTGQQRGDDGRHLAVTYTETPR